MESLENLFYIDSGSNLALNQMENSDDCNGIPFVSRTEKNNGVVGYVKHFAGGKLNGGHTLSVALGGTVLETFYQSRDYYTGYHIAVLTPKTNMSKNEMLFYAMCIKANNFKYSFGRQANNTIHNLVVPSLSDIPKYVASYHLKDFIINGIVNSEMNISAWSDCKLSNLFSIKRGNCKALNIISSKMGNNPIVSASEFNNGINNYTNEPTTYSKNTITLALNGSVGSCFYQDEDYLATNDVAVLTPLFETFSKDIGLILITMISSVVKMKFSYGRKCTPKELSEISIKLPVRDNEIDWIEVEKVSKQIQSKFSLQ